MSLYELQYDKRGQFKRGCVCECSKKNLHVTELMSGTYPEYKLFVWKFMKLNFRDLYPTSQAAVSN
jgi:hypothetical protein